MALLETQVRLLSAALKIEPDDLTTVVPDDVLELARAGEPIVAVRRLREHTGMKLVPAKRLVDAIRAGS